MSLQKFGKNNNLVIVGKTENSCLLKAELFRSQAFTVHIFCPSAAAVSHMVAGAERCRSMRYNYCNQTYSIKVLNFVTKIRFIRIIISIITCSYNKTLNSKSQAECEKLIGILILVSTIHEIISTWNLVLFAPEPTDNMGMFTMICRHYTGSIRRVHGVRRCHSN